MSIKLDYDEFDYFNSQRSEWNLKGAFFNESLLSYGRSQSGSLIILIVCPFPRNTIYVALHTEISTQSLVIKFPTDTKGTASLLLCREFTWTKLHLLLCSCGSRVKQ
jgi:hypothetical protein